MVHRSKDMRALLLTRYGHEGPSSRYRMFQFIPYLENAGIECTVQSFFREGYTELRFSNPKALLGRTLEDYKERIKVLKRTKDIDVILLEKEFFPYFPNILEDRFIPEHIPYVCDYDDAWFHVYDYHRNPVVRFGLSDKIPEVMKRAASVIVGSEYIARFATRYCRDVELLPTVIDLNLYPSAQPPDNIETPFTIGWIGSQSTLSHLRTIETTLDEFCSKRDARVVIIGPTSPIPKIKSLEMIPWSHDSEVMDLSMIDVGIMPLPDTPVARGKCAFKLIQYMACWKPVIASPVGETVNVVKEGENGFLASTNKDWVFALDRLFHDREYGKGLGAAGRKTVERNYCLSVTAPRLATVLRRAAVSGRNK